ncbi:MAG: GT2 family glycosyltransferase [Saprospiraceae bacterium]
MAHSVAVLIVNYNAQAYLPRCLEALAQQTYTPKRVIVMDNGSADDSIAAAKVSHPQFEYVELGSNTGFAAANNHGVELANDVEWVALLNPDAFVAPEWLEELVKASTENPQHQFFSSELMCDSPRDLIDGTGDCYHQSGLVWRRQHGLSKNHDQIGVSKHPMFSPCAAAALYKRDVFLEVGGFDEDYFCYIEDVDLVFRMRLSGYSGQHVAKSVAYHVGSAITVRDSDFSIYHGHRNLVWTYVKNMPSGLLLKTLPQHLLLNLLSLIYYTLKGRPKVIFKAKWHALKGLNKQLKKRKGIQASNKISVMQLESTMARGWLTPYLRRQA